MIIFNDKNRDNIELAISVDGTKFNTHDICIKLYEQSGQPSSAIHIPFSSAPAVAQAILDEVAAATCRIHNPDEP